MKEEKKGSRVGAPEAPLRAFCALPVWLHRRGQVQPDKKGDFYVAVIQRPGRPAINVIAKSCPR